MKENIPLLVKNQLNEAIAKTIAFHKAAFVHQAANFSRKRKLDIETMIKLLISMRGGSIAKELQSAFPHEKVSAAAFVKQRGKLSHKDFDNILDLNYVSQLADGTEVTNLVRMQKGLAPLDPATGKAYQLHHIGQKADGTLAVLTESQQQGNSAILNIFSKESEIIRSEFATTRKEFWEYLGKSVFVNGGV